MATITIQPGDLADPKDLPFSSSGSEPRSSFEPAANEKPGDEEALLPPSPPSQQEDQHPPSASRAKLLLWMLANALATIGIVCTVGEPYCSITAIDRRAIRF